MDQIIQMEIMSIGHMDQQIMEMEVKLGVEMI